jgi:class 3 adenylate cyclase
VGLTEDELVKRSGASRERVRDVRARHRAEVLVGEGARAAARSDDVAFEDLGPISLKGVTRPVRVYRALRRSA